jgi:hypothetical protein
MVLIKMKNLNTQTLENIRKYESDLLKLASFYSQSELPCYIPKISKIQPGALEKDIISAFISDIKTTSGIIHKSTKLLNTTKNGVIEGADGKPNIKDIFPESNTEHGTVQFGNINIDTDKVYDLEEITEALTKSILNISFNELQNAQKTISKAFTIQKSEITSEEEAIVYLAEKPTRVKFEQILNKIKKIQEDSEENRTNYTKNTTGNKYENINLIDRGILNSKVDGKTIIPRAMVDSIIQTSTHVSADTIFQSSKKHHQNDVKDIQSELKNNKYLSDIEIDPSADPKKVLDLLRQIRELKLNLPQNFTLKVRKLGNYKASGMCMPQSSIVAIDIDKPSSLIHELTHLADLTNDYLTSSEQRKVMTAEFTSKIDASTLPPGKSGYFTSENEVIARLGEISFLLNKFNYNGGSFSSFRKKVLSEQKTDNTMCVVKPIDTYIGNSNIYFGFGGDLDEKDLMNIKKYFQSYWGVDKPIKEKLEIFTATDIKKIKAKPKFKKTKAYTPTSFSNITKDTVVESYIASEEEDVLPKMVFAERILENMNKLHRTKKRISGDEVYRQFETVNALFEHIQKTGTKDEQREAYIILTKYSGSYYLPNMATLESILENFPGEKAKELYTHETYTNSQGLDYLIKDYQPATAYLNEYGERVGNKMITKLRLDYLKGSDTEDISSIIKEIQPSKKAFYETILFKQELCNDKKSLDELKSLLKKEKLLNIFKSDRVELIGKLLSSKVGSFIPATYPTIKSEHKEVLEKSYNAFNEKHKLEGDTTQNVFYNLNNKAICNDIVENYLYSINPSADIAEISSLNESLFRNYFFNDLLRSMRNGMDSPKSWQIHDTPRPTNQPKEFQKKTN